MKKTIKTDKCTYTVDFNDIETLDDIDYAFAKGKQKAGLPLTEKELMDIVEWFIDQLKPVVKMVCVSVEEAKKTPWYKRVWNWVKGLFKKKK